jgi:uncharacterized protein YrrD
MNIDLGADIIGKNGDKLGVVDSLVVEPDTGETQSVIVRKGLFFPTDKIVPIDLVTGVEDGKVHVDLSSDDAAKLTEYMDTEYLWPPAGYYGGYGYMWPAANVYANDMMVDNEVHERNPDALILSEGTLVVDKNGDDLGRVTEVASDEKGRVQGFKVEQGIFRHHEHYIPVTSVDTAADNVVKLRVDKDTLERTTGPRNLELGRREN